MNMSDIVRLGNSQRWVDVVVFGGVARRVVVVEDISGDAASQTDQVLRHSIDRHISHRTTDQLR